MMKTSAPARWGRYIYHDNNRDGLQMSARLTQELVDLFLRWHYPVGHDLHESVPYLYVSTGTGPYNPTVDPITVGEWQWLSNWEVTALTALGMPGVWTHGFYDGWYPGYLLWVTNTRNAVGRFYETFGNMVPNTMQRTLGVRSTEVEWYRPSPPRDTTLWSLRNNTNYMQTGVLHALYLVSQNRDRVLEQFWTKSRNAIEKGETEAPYAYVIPAEQDRRADAAYMLNLLRRQGIEVHRATAAGDFGEVEVERGDYVVRMDQPYRNFVLTLMQRQDFPADAPTPYDDVAWTFPLMFNVEAEAVDDAAVQELAMEPVTDSVALPGTLEGSRRADWYVVSHEGSGSALAARYALQDVPVYALEDSIEVDRTMLPPGAWLISGDQVDGEQIAGWARDFGLTVHGVGDRAVRDLARHEQDLPRIALLHTWRYTQDDGWVRYTLDHYGIPYTYLGAHKLKDGGLRNQFDVILFPTQGSRSSAKAIFGGVDPKYAPLAYTQTPEYPTHGTPDAAEDITGGMGYEGLAALQEFVATGGTLVTLGSASNLAADFALVREVGLDEPRELYVPGSLVQGEVAARRHPITYGYGETLPLYHQFGPYFSVPDDLKKNIVVRYAPADELFLSGLVKAPGELAGDPAIVSVPTGEGQVVMFGFDALHRFQTHGNFALVWNTIMNWNDLGVGLGEEEPEAVEEVGLGMGGVGRRPSAILQRPAAHAGRVPSRYESPLRAGAGPRAQQGR